MGMCSVDVQYNTVKYIVYFIIILYFFNYSFSTNSDVLRTSILREIFLKNDRSIKYIGTK